MTPRRWVGRVRTDEETDRRLAVIAEREETSKAAVVARLAKEEERRTRDTQPGDDAPKGDRDV